VKVRIELDAEGFISSFEKEMVDELGDEATVIHPAWFLLRIMVLKPSRVQKRMTI
jgi:hypothetical protein